MAERSEHDYEDMIQSLHEYTSLNITEQDMNKFAILELMKTHRPVKLVDYQYGFSYTLKNDSRIIIKEPGDGSRIREYGKTTKRVDYWVCSNRYVNSIKCYSGSLKFEYGILFVPLNHDLKCTTKEYSFAMEVQDLLKQGKVKEAYSLTVNYSKRLRNGPVAPLSEINESTTPAAADLIDVANASNHETDFDNSTSNFSPSIPRSSPLTRPQTSAKSRINRESVDNDDSEVLEETLVKRPRNVSNNNNVHPFCRPSDSILEQMCQRLGIQYSNKVSTFWEDIVIKEVVPFSNRIKTYEFKSENFYACLSLFFTGKMLQFSKIQGVIHNAFRRELIASKTKSSDEIIKLFTSPTATNDHIEFIAKFLECRIGIFKNGKLKKYGKWETQQKDILTLILSLINKEYYVVLNL